MERFKIETGRMKGAPECMRISEFMHGINNPELTKRSNEHVPRTMEEMMIATTAFIRGEAAAANKKKGHMTPKEILTAEANKFQPPPPMVTPVEKRNGNKFCDFHNDKRHSTDECMQLKKQIEELVRAGKLSHLIKEIKQGREQPKTGRKEAAAKDKPTTIYMVRSWQRTVKQKITQSFEQGKEITFPPLANSHGTEGPLVIEAEVGGHTIHRMYIDGGSSMEILYEHFFNRLRPDIKRQIVPATTSLTGFSDETTWPLGQLKLLVTIGDATHSTKAWMNFMIVKSLSPYNGIIGRPGGQAPERTKAIQAEVEKLVEAGIMREVFYHDWLSNPVMVKKHDGSWRMCVDFTDLNKACPQDCYPLPEIDWKVESLCGYPFKCFLDAYKGYHQIQMAAADEEKQLSTQDRRSEGVFLGYVITPGGIKPCPDKTTAVLQLPSPQTVKEVQSLNGKLASLNRFLSKSAEKSLPLFQTLKKCIKKSDFRWTTKAEQAFQKLKQDLSALPLLAAPKPQEELIMYLSATHGAISAVLMTERGTVMSRPDVAGRLQKWSIMLGEHNITYRPRTSIKGQILADFLNEIPSNASQGMPVAETQEEPWMLFTDGSSCVDGSGAGLILTNPDGVEFTYALRFQFVTSNNKAEYEALIVGLRIAKQMGVKNIQANVDSKLVANQVLGTYVAKEDNMIKYLDIAKGLVSGFKTFSISQVPRRKEITAVIEEEGPTWMTELVNYLKEGTLPEDEKKARKLRLKARQYELMEEILYKQSFLTPWLRCVGPLQAEYVMKEIHEGSCPFPEGPGKVKFLIVAMYYFTKWIEAKAVATITGGQVTKFVWDNIVCRFGIPGEIISDNGKQFANNSFKDWCDKLNITQHFASVKHPQSNRLVERANRSLWEVIPAEIGMPTYRTTTVDVVNNDEELRLNLDLLEERRELAAMNEARSKSKMMKYYNSQIRGVAFKPGDFVYRSNDASHAVAGGKLGPKWEGPYEVTDALGNGAYKLRSMDGMMLPRTWNVTNLKRCYL
nr:reverse transcriptase domain-containing protein [Tanacetum cinerariifolium]